MGKLSTLGSDGRITLPQDVRDALGLRPNEPVEIEWTGGDSATIRRPRAVEGRPIETPDQRVERLMAALERMRADPLFTRPTDEIMRELRGDEPLP